jgi:FKBP-type peptidyl-prolyl cis-trans isomerase
VPCKTLCELLYRVVINIYIFSNYAAYLEDGTCFDNSFKRSAPVNFVLGSKQLIEAIEMVVPLMSKGEKARIVVAPEVLQFQIFT